MESMFIYDIFNYSIANILSTYVKADVQDIKTGIIKDSFLTLKDSKTYLSSFTGDFQGTILMMMNRNTEKFLSAKLLETFTSKRDVDVFNEVLNIIIAHFSNAIEYEDKAIYHSPPIVVIGKEMKFRVFENSHLFKFYLKEGEIDFAIGIKE